MTLQTTPPPTHPTHPRNSMSVISPLILTRFWPNFKGRFLGHSRTDSNCYGGICQGNICPGNICPYQEYLSCYSTHLDETLNIGSWDHLDQIPTVLLKLTLFPTGVVVRMGPWSRINLFVCLNVGSWEHLEEIPTVSVTFVQATFVLATFVHIRNILAATSPILTKL